MKDDNYLIFYHGTSASSARAILQEGIRNPFKDLKIREFVDEVWPQIIELAGSFYETAGLFDEAGSEHAPSAPVALQNIFDDNGKSLYSYGSFYVTTSFRKAHSYAMRGVNGSELLLFLRDTFLVMKKFHPNKITDLNMRYATLLEALNQKSRPVVLEIAVTGLSDLRTEDGVPVSSSEPGIFQQAENTIFRIEPSFRIVNLAPSSVRAIFDVRLITPATTVANIAPPHLRIDAIEWAASNVD